MKVSVIIPTYNEASTIHKTLEDLITRHQAKEVLVVDGGSTDNTVALAKEWTTVLSSGKGRARQMNEGARHAEGDAFLFLHADTKLPGGGIEKIKEAILSGAEGGRFRMKFDEPNFLLHLYASHTRFQFFSYGDQGFFVRRKVFEKLKGFRENVPFEDIDFYRRLGQLTTPVILKDPVVTSARRFSGVGYLRQKLINIFLVTLYYAGINVFSVKEKLYPEIR